MKKRTKILLTTAIILLVAATAALGTLFGISEKNRRKSEARLSAVYEKSFYETADNMADVEVKLSKISVLSGRDLKRELLYDVWRQCDVSATNFSQLGDESEEISGVIKFLNQLGDYAYYLSVKLKNGNLTDEEEQNIIDYAAVVKSLNERLREAKGGLVDGKTVGLITADAVSGAIKANSSVEYPEMIYDGPFSDGLNDRNAKFLEGKEEISKEIAQEKVAAYFPTASDISYVGEGTSSIPCYLFEFALGRNHGTVQITKKGGYVAAYNAYCFVENPVLTEEECVEKADGYLKNMGYESLQRVWVSNYDSTVYINYAHTENGVVCYPDLIKVKICAETGDLIGLEAQNYLYNHTEREIIFPQTNPDYPSKLAVKQTNKCLVPTEWNTEIPAIEIIGEKDDLTFYVYIDPESGEEIRAMMVIANSQNANLQ